MTLKGQCGGQWTAREGRTKEVCSGLKLAKVFEVPC